MKQANNSTLRFHATQPYPCSYFPDRQARAQIVLTDYRIDSITYGKLVQTGFRRSGTFTYRPTCDYCNACIPARVIANKFLAKRSQRRTWKRHQHLVATSNKLYFDPAHYSLYQRYQMKRHNTADMNSNTHTQYQDFLLHSNVNSRLIEFHEGKKLRMISIVDKLSDGFSSVYTFFDPDISNASYGTYSILWQIDQCRKLNLPYVYLGYWIKENPKMRYKANFQPLETLTNALWQPFEADGTI